MGAGSTDYSEWNIDDKWSSQEWKSGEMLGARTERPIDDKFVIDHDVDSDTATESNVSLESRSFLNMVIDRLRKILDQSSKDAMQDIDKHSIIRGMFVSSTLEASVFIGKNYSENLHSIKNTWEELTLKQMFDISEKVDIGTIRWDFWSVSNQLWKFSMETIISGQWWRSYQSLACKGLRIFRFCVGKVNQNPTSNAVFGTKNWVGSRVHHNTELWTQLTESRWNSSGIFSQGSPHCSSSKKSRSSCLEWAIQHNSKE